MIALIASAGAAAATWLVRVLLIAIVPASRLPGPVQRVLPHVGPAVLAALVAAVLFGSPDGVQPAFLVAAALTGAVAWWRGNILLATGVGLAAVAGAQLL
jgi:branched-subunit amino acid transport protein